MDERKRLRVEQTDSEPDAAVPLRDDGTFSGKKQSFLQIVKRSSEAVQRGDFSAALRLYSEGLSLDPSNHILFSNRSAALIKLGAYKKALQDARKAIELNPSWPKAYYREGVALQCLNREADALASYATGLAEDPKSCQLLTTFIEAATQSTLRDELVPVLSQLQRMQLDQSPFLVVSVVGQVLLEAGSYKASVTVLESALRIGTCSQKLKGSVFSALSNAHWAMGHIDPAIVCMRQDLTVAKALGDEEGECRAHSNLGAALFSKGAYRDALQHHRSQLILAMKYRQRATAAIALDSLGHVYTALGDYANALASHKQCVLLAKQGKDKYLEAKEIGNVGTVYLALGQLDKALECHGEHLKLAKQLGNRIEEARAYSNMGSAHHYKRDFDKAIAFHNQVLNIALDLKDRALEARAYAGLGHASRCTLDFSKAKYYHEKQLDNALQTKDKMAEGRACSNLGIIYQHFQEFEAALKLNKVHLQIAKDLGDRASQGRAYGNIGNAHSALGQYELAIRFHKQELAISKEVGDKHSECSTHGNLAVAYHSMKMLDKAIDHYNTHLLMARDLKDTPSEARALSNIGNYYCSKKHFQQAIPYYEQYLILSQELQDIEGEGKACHKLGYVHYCLGNFREAIRYYEQDLALAKDIQDKVSMCRAYCNLGLAHKALGEHSQALDCQKYFLATAHMTQNLSAKFCALGNIGDVLVKLEEKEEALGMFTQQLQLSKQVKDKTLEAVANANLGCVQKQLRQFDKALACHTQELNLYQEQSNLKGECKAHSNLGSVHMALGRYNHAYRCYEEQLDRSRDLKDGSMEANAYGNLGITKVNMDHYDEAIGLFEQQLAVLEQTVGPHALKERGRAQGNLADCYEAIGDYEEAIKNYEQYLAVAQSVNCLRDQDRAYRGLGNSHRAMGNLQQALVCFEKRLLVAHEMDEASSEGSAYGELGCLHSLLGNFEQAISCLQHQLRLAREGGDSLSEGEAACGLGGVYQQMGEYERALDFHQLDLRLAREADNSACQCRAFGNLGLSYESLLEHEKAVEHQLQHLSIATKMNDTSAMTLAYSSLGRIHHAMGKYAQAVKHLTQGLQIACDQNGSSQDEAKIRHRLGLALWGHGNLHEAQKQLYAAVDLFEGIRREAQFNNDYKLSLFDLQTASYQALQRVLVSLERHDEALVIAERGRTRAFVDFLLERQTVTGEDTWHSCLDSTPASKEVIMDIVNKQRSALLYFSIAGGFLYSWLVLPERGIVKFHESSLVDPSDAGSDPEDTQSVGSVRSLTASGASLLDSYVGQARESLGIESHLSSSRLSKPSFSMSETESEADDLWQQHLEEIGDRLNAENDRTGFLRMVNRHHVWNSSTYSLGSLVSVGGGGALGPRTSIRSSSRSSISCTSSSSKAPLSSLYELLIAPFEEELESCECQDLILVLQGDLYLAPFSLLKSKQASPFLYERFQLLVIPSIRSLQASQAISKHNRYSPDCTGAVVIGNPQLPQGVQNTWQWPPIAGTEEECRMVAEMMGCRSLTGPSATKDNVVRQIQRAELIHFATHISWKLSAIVLSPGDYSSSTSVHGHLERMDLNSSSSDLSSVADGPPLSEFLLTAADVLNIRISAKLVVLSSGHTDERAGRINADGVVGLTRAFLAAGAQCVLFSLWPVPEMAARILLRSFYTGLLQGHKTSQALSQAIGAVRNTRQFAHPSNWASWLLVGSEVKLSSKVALMGHALAELLRTPQRSREAMRVVLHLVEKSLQRINHGQHNAMYTTQHSIENKVGEVAGWKDLLTAMGFRFETAANGLPASVFFPTTDPGDRLTQCSASLQALLGLAVPTLTALSKMIEHQEVGEALSLLLKEVSAKFMQENSMQMQVGVRLWRAPGCHEFLASLGFDLVEVGKEEVTIKAGKQANKRTLQFALQALVAVFDTQSAPRSLFLDSCSSMESLASSTGSASTTSNFSKTSSPCTSPTDGINFKRRSYFNPAEVNKLPSANLSAKEASKAPHVLQDPSLHLSLQNAIRQKYSSPSASDVSDSDQARVLSIEVGDGTVLDAAQKQRVRTKQAVASQYSSDSEDAGIPPDNLSRLKSRSSLSLASQSSTLTTRSTCSSGPLRRGRQRSSVTSTKSSTSDHTVTAVDNVHDSRESLAEGGSVEEVEEEKEEAGGIDPTEVAEKVLAETQQHRKALECMQQWTMDNLAEKQKQADVERSVPPKEELAPPEPMEAEELVILEAQSVKPLVNRQPVNSPSLPVVSLHEVNGAEQQQSNVVSRSLAVAQLLPATNDRTPIMANSVRDECSSLTLEPAAVDLCIPLLETNTTVRTDDTYFSDSSVSYLSKIPEEDEENCSQAENVSRLRPLGKSMQFNDEVELRNISSASLHHSDSVSSSDSSSIQNGTRLHHILPSSAPDYSQYRYKPPPPYPGLSGSRDSTSSVESMLSSQGSSSQGSTLFRKQLPPRFNANPVNMPPPSLPRTLCPQQGRGYHNGLNSEGSSSEQETYELYSPKNLQRASLQFYKSGACASGVNAGPFKPYVPPDAPAFPRNGGLGAASKVNDPPKEWYLSDSDSVCSFQETQSHKQQTNMRMLSQQRLPNIQEGRSAPPHRPTFDLNSSSDQPSAYDSTGSSSQSLPPQPSMEWHEMLYGNKTPGRQGPAGTLPKELQQQLPRQQYGSVVAHASKC